MSRETDTPSSGPNGRGGAAYPSGTPPYGTPAASDGSADAGRSAKPEDRKTETTLTTRIRINIPGSRPIPPVVVRKPVADAEGKKDDTAETAAPAPAPGAAMSTGTPAGTVEAPAEPVRPAGEKTSDWFAPRKSGAPKGGQGGGAANGAGVPGGSGTPAGTPAGSGTPAAGASGGARPGGVVGAMSVTSGSRPGGANGARPGTTSGAGLPGATGGPVAPGHGGGTGSFDVTEALNAGSRPTGPRPGQGTGGEARRDDLPYFSEGDRGGAVDGQGGGAGQGGYGGPGAPGGPNSSGGPGAPGGPNGFDGASGFDGPNGFGGPGGAHGGPAGPTTGPVTGDGPLVPPTGPGGQGGPGGYGGPGAPGGPSGLGGPGAPGAPGTMRGGEPFGSGPGTAPGGGLSDDTAILTPQKPAPEPGPQGGYPAPDNVSGHTVTSGIPVVPPGAGSPFGPGTPADGPLAHTPPKLPEPVAQDVPAAAPAKKKGRSKLALLCVALFLVAGGAYGAGLLMNHTDVPKGTTVLGVDIGGGTRDDAVKKLDAAFGERVNQPLKLSVGGDTVTLKPDQAGLQFDEQATVAAAAKSDYNPVSVIGSLLGKQRVVEPVMPVDEEKLSAALQDVAGGSGSMTEGTIKFASGKAVAVYGKPGKGIDIDRSTDAIVTAYRAQVETGSTTPAAVATTTKQPTISNAEVDRELKEFAQPAMSAPVTVQTDAAHSIIFSPQNSLWKFLRVKAVNGKLVDSPDMDALKQLYGHTFDEVLITRGTGQKTAVTPQDVYVALRQALLSKTNRVAVIDTDPS
ncbi:hypothetical protein ABT301_08750 [Streptomyces sp. NPDC000987]|uniref:hypothetical protein n=1 Tax=Streptomyces sp. NPDC000987 TaxID=3154374 RepID=UPI003325922C